MPGLFKCQLTKRFLHSVLCCCVETFKKRPLRVIPRLSHGTTSTCTCENSLVIVCEHKLHSVGHTVNCVQNENQKVQLFLGWLSFTSSPWGLKQTCMLARHRLHKSARCFNKFGSKSLCLFHIDLKIIPPMSYVICCLP